MHSNFILKLVALPQKDGNDSYIFALSLGAFYYTLGTVRPMYRSTIRNIHLLGIAKTDDIKAYGIDALFYPIIEEINSLATVTQFRVVLQYHTNCANDIYICVIIM